MNKNLQQYSIEKNAIKEAYTRHMGLKFNTEYEQWANNTTVFLVERFLNEYKGVKIQIPKLREKSPRSTLGKIKNLQIERLSKLFAIEGIDDKQKEELYSLLEERVNENKDIEDKKILQVIKKLIYTDEINIKEFENNIMCDEISNSTKTALLRILVSKLQQDSKKEDIDYLEERYGKKQAERTGYEEDDVIRYDSIRNIESSPVKLDRLKDENRFLKANDLRGMKIVVKEIPDDFETDNIKIKELLEKRIDVKTKEDYEKYTHLAIVELGKEFFNNLIDDEEFLESIDTKIIKDSRRHKYKRNGYEAEHIKLINVKEPEYTLEMQFKSDYVEKISKGNGSASHENRPGKARALPNAINDTEMIEKINEIVPKYTTFNIENGRIKPKKQTMLVNVMSYFQDKIEIDSEEYNKIMDLFSEKDERQIG